MENKMTKKEKASSEGPKVSPSGDMLTAHLLAMLNGWSAYGYELAQRLEESGIGKYNKGSIYRLLRQLEDSGMVSSKWDTSKDGPARRIYDLTDGGSLFLENWMTMIKMHQSFISGLMELNPLMKYATGLGKTGKSSDKAKADSDDESEQEKDD
ncbi:MAG: poly-beta-hydroxybutyrate-responsive repressor [Pseudohongiellaceae bacterium]|jgi:poly-beta-hydroxybutyrate-responsive repressor